MIKNVSSTLPVPPLPNPTTNIRNIRYNSSNYLYLQYKFDGVEDVQKSEISEHACDDGEKVVV